MQNKTLSQHSFRSRQVVQLQQTKPGNPVPAGMPYKFIKQRRLKRFFGSSSFKKKWKVTDPFTKGFLDPPISGEPNTNSRNHVQWCVFESGKTSILLRFFYDQVKDVNHPNIFKSHEDTPPLTTARAREKSGSWEATLPKCSLMVMPHDVEGTQ